MAELVSSITDFLSNIFRPLMNNIMLFILIILIGFIIARISGRIIQKVLQELELNKLFEKITGSNYDTEELIGATVTFFIYIIAIIMAFNKVGLTMPIINTISAVIILVVFISMLLAVKEIMPNIFSGISIHRKGFKAGDKIMIHGTKGKIISIKLTETRIETKEGDIIYIPNSLLTRSEIKKIGR